ncbi:DUF2326 domain-containing protein [uncultured Bacteroides sp.]|uniref:DUF2326 domain-containing protein n=1 Tax=uncultured Bacteroides sp. TaxID=162156 RepID=UPI002619EB30|nr:DUF2326 domain-containing protein [uncultured Bacteroides sp.]
MYLKRLKITNQEGLVRNIEFHSGLNLIVDNTPENDRTETGNSVGKTTVLRLVDFCLGKDGKVIYTDPADNGSVHTEVKEFLQNTKVEVELTMTRNWTNDDVVIRRDFSSGRKAVRTINGVQYKAEDFESALSEHILGFITTKPTFRQIISHNIRYSELSLTNVLKTLDPYTSDAQYEALYLFMFGCQIDETDRRQELIEKIKTEQAFKKRLEKSNNKSTYRTLLGLVDAKIEALQIKKATLNVNPDFEKTLGALNDVKFKLNAIGAELATLKLKQDTVREAQKEIEEQHSEIDSQQLATIYQQAKALVPNIQKTFEELLSYHNKMVESRSRFIAMSLPMLAKKIEKLEKELKSLLIQEEELANIVTKSDTYEDLEELISEMNQEYQRKGEYENQIQQIEIVETAISEAEEAIKGIDEDLFSNEFRDQVQNSINRFNILFTDVSKLLYDEEYVLKVDAVNYRNTGRYIYKFSAFNANLSSGKKMGEISCFDIAYTMFARDNGIPHLSFLLNDKRELMSDNQLVAIAQIVEREDIQFVASILKDKLPTELQDSRYYIAELSKHDKLFRIEG